jgi:alpha-N-acetylglucosaminidase
MAAARTLYFDSLNAALKAKTEPAPVDWFAVEDAWNRQQNRFPVVASGDAYAQALAIYKDLRAHPADWSNVHFAR